MSRPTAGERWISVSREPEHPLHRLEGRPLAGGHVQVLLGRTSRFGARYFAIRVASQESRRDGATVLSGLHQSGPLPTYNWIEVAETQLDPGDVKLLFSWFYELLPPGGHLMVEYDSEQRAETAQALARGVPPIATALGESLFRLGFGAHFKDWQIAEGGSEGPRKLQAYKPPTLEDDRRWRRGVARQLTAFLAEPIPDSEPVRAARERAAPLLASLTEP